MAIIYTYPVKTTPANDDLILISDSADGNKTKQVKMSSLPGAEGSGITSLNTATGASQTFAIGNDSPVTISTNTSTGVHTFGWTGELAIAKGGTALSSVGTKHQSLVSSGTALTYKDQKIVKKVKLASGSVVKGQPLFIKTTTSTDVPIVGPADANTSAQMPVAGLAMESISNTDDFYMMINGYLDGLNTTNIPGSPSPGSVLYINNEAGGGADIDFITATKVSGASSGDIQTIGILARDHASLGAIQVCIDGEVEGLPNFSAKGNIWAGNDTTFVPTELAVGTDGHILTADSSEATGIKWAAAAASGVTTINFSTTGLTPNSATAGAITVGGVLIGANGGTGYNTYSPGQILYGASGLSPAGTLSKLNIGAAGKVLTVNSGGTAPEWADPSTTAAGTAGNIQFNDGSNAFTASANLSYTTGSNTLDIGVQGTSIGNLNVNGSGSGLGILKLGGSGSGAGAPFVKLSVNGASADTYTVVFPRNAPSLNNMLYVSGFTGSGTTQEVQLNSRATNPVSAGGTGQSATAQYSVFVGTSTTAVQKSSSSTDAIQMPVGTTAQRPGSPVNGMIRYNSTSSKMEAYAGGAWVDLH